VGRAGRHGARAPRAQEGAPCRRLYLSGGRRQVAAGVAAALAGGKVDAVLCVAGGWAGGNAADARTPLYPPPP
jgi:hypothetical protein